MTTVTTRTTTTMGAMMAMAMAAISGASLGRRLRCDGRLVHNSPKVEFRGFGGKVLLGRAAAVVAKYSTTTPNICPSPCRPLGTGPKHGPNYLKTLHGAFPGKLPIWGLQHGSFPEHYRVAAPNIEVTQETTILEASKAVVSQEIVVLEASERLVSRGVAVLPQYGSLIAERPDKAPERPNTTVSGKLLLLEAQHVSFP